MYRREGREGGGERPGERVSSEAGYPASIYIIQILSVCVCVSVCQV